MFEALSWAEPKLSEDKPQYFMEIGYPDQIVKAVGKRMDMFDVVLPTRFGLHGTEFTSEGRKILTNAEFGHNRAGIDPLCDCMVCKTYSRDYLCHLCRQEEMAGLSFVSYHNLKF